MKRKVVIEFEIDFEKANRPGDIMDQIHSHLKTKIEESRLCCKIHPEGSTVVVVPPGKTNSL